MTEQPRIIYQGHADIKWWVYPSAGRYAEAWDPAKAKYDSRYAASNKVAIHLSGCDDPHVMGEKATYFWWFVKPLKTADNGEVKRAAAALMGGSTQPDHSDPGQPSKPPRPDPPVDPGTRCNTDISLSAGQYQVTLGISRSKEAGPELWTARNISVDRVKIGIVGDSMAAGEGNPDRGAGINECYEDAVGFLLTGLTLVPSCWLDFVHIIADAKDYWLNGLPEARWLDRRCHRSRTSGYAWAAGALDWDDPTNAVTVLSFACSGAEPRHVASVQYDGKEKKSSDRPDHLPFQLAALKDALPPAPDDPNGRRPIDALLVSVGINEIDFAGLLKRCANIEVIKSCDTREYDHVIEHLHFSYDHLWNWMRGLVKIEPSRVYITEYPVYLFGNGGGCGAFSGVTKHQADKVRDLGLRLNQEIKKAADKNGWTYVGGIAEGFKDHHYCATESWFVGIEAAVHDVGYDEDRIGAVHPNAAGQRFISTRIREAFEATGFIPGKGYPR